MIVGIPKETYPGERRVAMVPTAALPLLKTGLEVRIESGAGLEAGFGDEAYTGKGVAVVPDREELISGADVLLQVRGYGANLDQGARDLSLYKPGQALLGFHEPLSQPRAMTTLAEKGASTVALELVPRITKAQSMDALSSMATVAGYKGVLLAAERVSRMFPLLMTAAGTLSPVRLFVVGAGVAGLQAIATARRLGAVVEAYDLRPAVKEQVESLGARFVEIEVEAGEAEDSGGYARQMDETFYRKQRELMARVVAESDVVITTAAVPGKKAPVLITEDMVRAMKPGSVIVDLAAERGGNCESTKPGEEATLSGVIVLGPLNLPATVPFHASQMIAKNLANLLLHLLREGDSTEGFTPSMEDEITKGTLVTWKGEVVHPAVLEASGENPSPRE